MPKPKFLKPLIFGVVGISLASLVVGLSINWSHTKYLQAVGSSGVKPFVEAFGTEYHKTHTNLDVAVEAGGTTFAIEQVAKGYAQIGNASNNPYWSLFTDSGEPKEFADLWGNKKTLTLGWEAVGILYKVPTGLSDVATKTFDILITKDNILDLYAVFSGFNESKTEDGVEYRWDDAQVKENNSMYHYLSKASKAIIDSNPKDKEIVQNTTIYPYLRSGGNTGANSSIAFTYYSNLTEFDKLTTKQQNAFKGGQYGQDHKYGETDEANAKAWALLSEQDREGAMTYMTSGFYAYEDNIELMRQKGFKVASYLPKDITDESKSKNLIKIDPTTGKYVFNVSDIASTEQEGYNWFRPINVMIDLNDQRTKDFIWWVFFGTDKHEEMSLSETYEQIMIKRGANPLSLTQFNSMLSNDGDTIYDKLFAPTASDIELSKTREGEWKQQFGACEWRDE